MAEKSRAYFLYDSGYRESNDCASNELEMIFKMNIQNIIGLIHQFHFSYIKY